MNINIGMGAIAVTLRKRMVKKSQSCMKLDGNPSIVEKISGLSLLSDIFHVKSNFLGIV
jgi:hypothetical protein